MGGSSMRLVSHLSLVTAFLVADFTFGCASSSKQSEPVASQPAAPVVVAAKPSAVLPATPVAAAPIADELKCSLGKESRVLKLEASAPKGCKLSDSAKKDLIATSSSSKEHCEKIREKVRGKLESAGYKCSASSAAIDSSSSKLVAKSESIPVDSKVVDKKVSDKKVEEKKPEDKKVEEKKSVEKKK
jgi:1,4-alpha-glucan branching enzyme